MTNDGNFNINNVNTVKIPTVNTSIATASIPTPIGATANGIGLYTDDDYIYIMSQNLPFISRASKTDGLNFVPFKNSQSNGFFNNIYQTHIGSYYYAYGRNDDLGSYNDGDIFRAHVDTPMSWYDTGANSASNSNNAMIYADSTNIYLLGGETSLGVFTNAIDVASLSTPTTFVTSGNTLPAARIAGALATVGSTIYMYGGSADNNNSENTIYTASTSAPTTWSVSGSTLPRPIHNAVAYVDASYVYLFGGTDSSGAVNLNTIYRAPIGTPTTFTSAGTLPATIYHAKIFVAGTNLYMIGDSDGGGSGIMKSTTADPTTWTAVNQPALATAQANTHVAIQGSKVYAFGGFNSGGSLSNVIQSADTAHPLIWSNEVSTLPAALGKGQLIKTKNSFYIIGGNGTTGNDYKASQSAPTTWSAGLTTGPTRTAGRAIIIEDEVFYIGGETAAGTPVNTISRGVIENGSIVNWDHNPASAFMSISTPIPLSRFSLIQAGDYIYLVGGYTTGPTMNTNIYRIQKNRIVGSSGYTTWINVGSITHAMVESSVAIINNTVYLIGGGPSTSFTTTDDYVLSANMNELANGVVQFIEENTAIDSGIAGAAAVCLNDDLYLFGGRSSTNGSTSLKRNQAWSTHRLVLPKVPESLSSIPTIDFKTGTIGSYSAFQRTGLLPWLITDK